MSDFIIIPAQDPVAPLKTAFAEFWSDLLEYADPDTPHLMYSGLAELLLARRAETDLWARAYDLFNVIAEGTNKSAQEAIVGAFERLGDSDLHRQVEPHLGLLARKIYSQANSDHFQPGSDDDAC